MARILTLTMNPALDAFTSVAKLEPSHKLRCGPAQFHPGGGGINVARVLHRLGADVLALFPAGGLTGDLLRRLLSAEAVPAECVPIGGDTRESFSVHETSSGQDWRFVLPGPVLAEAEWTACLERATALLAPGGFLVASGSLPPGVPQHFLARLARAARARGCRVALDASGAPLALALQEGVEVVKPSQRELADLVGHPLDSPAAQRAACSELVASGRARMVALSLGAEGALLATREGCWRAPALEVQVASTIGAGDSFLAGLLWAVQRGQTPPSALAHAMAAGAAALLTPGTALTRREDLERLLPVVHVQADAP